MLPLEEWHKQGEQPPRDTTQAETMAAFASPEDPHYQNMLSIIRHGRRDVLAQSRVDMPGAAIVDGYARQFVSPPLPDPLPKLEANTDMDGRVRLTWERSARTIGLLGEVHRGNKENFNPNTDTLLNITHLFEFTDENAPVGIQYYAPCALLR